MFEKLLGKLKQHGRNQPNQESAPTGTDKSIGDNRYSQQPQSMYQAEIRAEERFLVADLPIEKASQASDEMTWEVRQHVVEHLTLLLKDGSDFLDYATNPEYAWGSRTQDSQTRVRDEVSRLVEHWSQLTTDGYSACILQSAAQDEFDLRDTARHWEHQCNKVLHHGSPEMRSSYMKAARAFLRAQYMITQEELRRASITHLTLFRGISGANWLSNESLSVFRSIHEDVVTRGTVALNPLSSFTPDPWVAKNFAGQSMRSYVIVHVPVQMIASSGRTGQGDLSEFVVLGGSGQALVFKSSRWLSDPPRLLSKIAEHLIPEFVS